jgi:hypothetical protein
MGLAAAQSPKPVVEAHVVLATDAGHANSTVKMAVLIEVASGYHINDHKPNLEYLISTELKLEPGEHVTVKSIAYPKGVPRKFAFSDRPLSVYENSTVFGAVLQIARGTLPGSYPIKGKLDYQACNDHACLPPASVPLDFSVKVVRRAVPLKAVNQDVFARIQLD